MLTKVARAGDRLAEILTELDCGHKVDRWCGGEPESLKNAELLCMEYIVVHTER